MAEKWTPPPGWGAADQTQQFTPVERTRAGRVLIPLGVGIAGLLIGTAIGMTGNDTTRDTGASAPQPRVTVTVTATPQPATTVTVTATPPSQAQPHVPAKPKAVHKPKTTTKTTRHNTPQPPSNVYYANCSEARAAGVAPLYVGDAGYRSGLDRDNDGVACE